MYREDAVTSCVPPEPVPSFTSHGPNEFSSYAVDNSFSSPADHITAASVHGGDVADRRHRFAYPAAERSTAGSIEGVSSCGSGSSHGSASSHFDQHHLLRRHEAGDFPLSPSAERPAPGINRVASRGAVYAAAGSAEIEYGYERYSHPGAKFAAGPRNILAPRGNARANSLGRQSWSYDSHAAPRASEYRRDDIGDGYNRTAIGAIAGLSSSGLRRSAGGGARGEEGQGSRFSGRTKVGDESGADRRWWRYSMNEGGGGEMENRYATEIVSCAAASEILVGKGGRLLTHRAPECSRQMARVMAVLDAAAEGEDVAHAGVRNSGSAGTGMARVSRMASAKSVLAVMAIVSVVLLLLPACLPDMGPPPAELMLIPVVVMLLLFTLVLTPTVSSSPHRTHSF